MSSSNDLVGYEEPTVNSDIAAISDEMLVVRVARWDQPALAEIYRRHSGPVCALGSRVLNDRQLADDIAQDVFLRLWNEPEKFDARRGSLRTYLLTMTHGRAIDLLRSRSSQTRRDNQDAGDSFDNVIDDLEREVIDLSVAEQVKKACSELAPEQLEALEMTYFKGYTYREAARLLNEPEGTIKGRIRAGLRRLGDLLPPSLDPTILEET